MSWKSIVKNVAPILGTALGGPLAGTATKFIAAKLLGDESAQVEDLEQFVLTASPDKLTELKKLDNDFKLQMKKLDIDVFALHVDNTKSARDMAKSNMWPQISLSALFVIGYFVIVYFLIDTEKELNSSLMLIMGVITAAIPQILNFWFGSTQGSKDKTALLGKTK